MQQAEEAEFCSAELQPFLKPFNLYSYLNQHIAEQRVFLRRNLSYYAPELSAGYRDAEASHFVTVHLRALQLTPAYSDGLVLHLAVCRTLSLHGGQVLVPLAAKVVLLPASREALAPVQLPVTQANSYKDPLEDLVVLMLHSPSPSPAARGREEGSEQGPSSQQQLLDFLLSTKALQQRGGKSISCDLEQRSPFGWPRPGARVLHITVPLQHREQHEAAVELVEGVFQVHMPQPGGLGFPSLSVAQRGLSDDVRLEYRLVITQQQQQQQAAVAGVRANGGLPQPQQAQHKQQQQRPLNGLPSLPQLPLNGKPVQQQQQQQQQQGTSLAGSKRKQDDRDGAANGQSGRPPPPPHGRRVWASLYSMDGKLQMEQPMDGNICLICNLRCRSFAGLQQHLLASHDYFEYSFADERPGLEPEVAIRCRRELYDESGEFLPAREIYSGDQGRQSLKLWQMDTFWFSLPPHRRHTRWLPGFHPRLTHNPSLGQKGDGSHGSFDVGAEGGEFSGPGGGGGSALVSQLSGVEEEEEEEEQEGSGMAAAADDLEEAGCVEEMGPRGSRRQKHQRKSKQKQRQVKAAPLHQSKQGLALLTPDGRLKFYHSRSCVAMTHQELLADEDSDDDSDSPEWKRDCWQRLYEAGGEDVAQRDFMFRWDLFLHNNPLHADEDVPRALAQFKSQQAQQGAADAAFHRQFACLITNLWRFRLLTPDQAFELLQRPPQQQQQQQQPGATAAAADAQGAAAT